MNRNPDQIGYGRDLAGQITPQRLDRAAHLRRARAALYLRSIGAHDIADMLGVGELYTAAGPA